MTVVDLHGRQAVIRVRVGDLCTDGWAKPQTCKPCYCDVMCWWWPLHCRRWSVITARVVLATPDRLKCVLESPKSQMTEGMGELAFQCWYEFSMDSWGDLQMYCSICSLHQPLFLRKFTVSPERVSSPFNLLHYERQVFLSLLLCFQPSFPASHIITMWLYLGSSILPTSGD